MSDSKITCYWCGVDINTPHKITSLCYDLVRNPSYEEVYADMWGTGMCLHEIDVRQCENITSKVDSVRLSELSGFKSNGHKAKFLRSSSFATRYPPPLLTLVESSGLHHVFDVNYEYVVRPGYVPSLLPELCVGVDDYGNIPKSYDFVDISNRNDGVQFDNIFAEVQHVMIRRLAQKGQSTSSIDSYPL